MRSDNDGILQFNSIPLDLELELGDSYIHYLNKMKSQVYKYSICPITQLFTEIRFSEENRFSTEHNSQSIYTQVDYSITWILRHMEHTSR